MEIQNFVSLVEEMRTAQKEYFKTRSYTKLTESKSLEIAVDKAVREMKKEAVEIPQEEFNFGEM